MASPDTHGAIEVVFKAEFGRLVAGLTGLTRDLDVAQELAQDALVAALEQWPRTGVPRNPGAWLMVAAKRRAISLFRRNERLRRKYAELGRALERENDPQTESEMPDDPLAHRITDDLLRLIFTACHPVLPWPGRVALTLRLLGGLSTDEIARAFLTSESTVAQRIVRAKKVLARERVPFEIPTGDDLVARLASVLDVVYLIFNEGYSATVGADWLRPALCEEALRLGRLLAESMPTSSETHGLVALMELQASRFSARTAPDGSVVLLLDQDRTRWDDELLDRGLRSLARAESAAPQRGPFTVQAAIAACHGRARTAADTDWAQIVGHYEELFRLTPSPVVALNRAVAVAMMAGPAAALPLVDALIDDPKLARYHLLPSVRGDLLDKLGRGAEARVEFRRAAEMTRNARERELLNGRADRAGFE